MVPRGVLLSRQAGQSISGAPLHTQMHVMNASPQPPPPHPDLLLLQRIQEENASLRSELQVGEWSLFGRKWMAAHPFIPPLELSRNVHLSINGECTH